MKTEEMNREELHARIGVCVALVAVDGRNQGGAIREIMSLIDQYIAEIIGADEEGPIDLPGLPGLKLDDIRTYLQNKLRAEQRKKAGIEKA